MRFKTRLDKIQEKITPSEVPEIFVLYDQEQGTPKQLEDLKRIKDLEQQGKNPQIISIRIVKTKEDLREVK